MERCQYGRQPRLKNPMVLLHPLFPQAFFKILIICTLATEILSCFIINDERHLRAAFVSSGRWCTAARTSAKESCGQISSKNISRRLFGENPSTRIFNLLISRVLQLTVVSIATSQALKKNVERKSSRYTVLVRNEELRWFLFFADRQRKWKNNNLKSRRERLDLEGWDVLLRTESQIRRRDRHDDLIISASGDEGNVAVL